ncbi:MAG: YitT family protein [Candidatus Faecousia sp.]|nr:YitT family protein [Candidatus Faecousia sp.]
MRNAMADVGKWAKRIVLLLVGLTIAHLGVTLFLLAELGSDPFNVLIQGLYRALPWPDFMTHGYVHMGVSFGIILVLLMVDRSYIRIGTLLCMFLGGPIIDAFSALLEPLIHARSPMVLRLGALVAGCVILAFGMTIVICSKAGTGPNDLVAVVISDKTHWKFGVVRIVVDVCFAGAGFLLGGTVGLGTVICAFVVGPAAQIFLPVSGRLCDRVLGKEPESA